MKLFNQLIHGLDTLIGWATAAFLAVAFLMGAFGVFERYFVQGSGTDWLIEVMTIGMVWAILLSIPRIENRRAHIRMDIAWRRFSYRGKVISEWVSLLLGLAFSLFIVYSGWLVVKDSMRWNELTDSSLRMPYWYYYISLSTAFSLHILFVIHRLVLLAQGEVELEIGDLESEIGTTGDFAD